MNLQNIRNEIKEILGYDFISVETGTWNDDNHYIYIKARFCSLYQAMKISRISGDDNPLCCADFDNSIKITVDIK